MHLWVTLNWTVNEIVFYTIHAEWAEGTQKHSVTHRFSQLYKFYHRLIRRLPPQVKHSLPPFPQKVLFNKSLAVLEKRRVMIERFVRGLIHCNYIQRRLYMLKPIGLEQLDLSTDLEQEKRKSITRPLSVSVPLARKAILEANQPSSVNQNLSMRTEMQLRQSTPINKLLNDPGSLASTSPTGLSEIRAANHRNTIPKTVAGYHIDYKLADCLEVRTSLYRASRGPEVFLLKIQQIDPQSPAPFTLPGQFEIQAQLVEIPGVPQIVELINYERNIQAIVMRSWPHTTSLLSDLESPMEVKPFLRIAVGIAEVLDEIHMHGLSYGSLSPNTIWSDLSENRVYLPEFCLSKNASTIVDEADPGNVPMLPLLPYMAPEVIRQFRSPSCSSDLYSFGMILFEMLTGRMPFDCSKTDRIQLIHAHLATKPFRADEVHTGIPKVVADIIDKLLQKEPSNRYITARGVYVDLEHCLQYVELRQEWDTSAIDRTAGNKRLLTRVATMRELQGMMTLEIPTFPLGIHDISDAFQIQDKLYERKQTLLSFNDRLNYVESSGKRQIILLHGPSGCGKTAVLSQMLQQLNHDVWFSLTVAFDQSQTATNIVENSEYLLSLFSRSGLETRKIGHQILSRSKFEVDKWRDTLTNTLSADGQVLLNYIPSLRDVLGPSISVPKNSNVPPENLFMVMCKFIASLAGAGHPLLLAIDNMQWINRQMLQLFTTLISMPGLSHIVFVLAYRDDDSHPPKLLQESLSHCERLRLEICDLKVNNLSVHSIQELIGDSIGISSTSHLSPLAEAILKKTSGNPLFVTQFLRTIHEEKLLRFDELLRKWVWDLDKILQKPSTDNVIEFMINETEKLSAKQKKLLQIASCIGLEFELATLIEVLSLYNAQIQAQQSAVSKEKSTKRKRPRTLDSSAGLMDDQQEEFKEKQVLNRLLIISERDMITRVEHSSQMPTCFAFTHERIHRASYLSLPPRQRTQIHLLIGNLWLEEHNNGPSPNSIPSYRIIRQLNLGASLITDRTFQIQLAEYNMNLARNAIKQGALDQELECAKAGIELLLREGEVQAWKKHYSLLMDFHLILYSRQDENENHLFDMLLQRSRSKLHKVKLFSARLKHFQQQNISEAISCAVSCLESVFKVSLCAQQPTIEQLFEFNEQLQQLLKEKGGIMHLIECSPQTRPSTQFNGEEYAQEQIQLRLAAQQLVNNCTSLYMYLSNSLTGQFSILSVLWSINWGLNEHSIMGLITYGVSCIHLLDNVPLAIEISELLLQLRERFPHLQGLINHAYFEWFHYWKNQGLTLGFSEQVESKEEEFWSSYRELLARNHVNHAVQCLKSICSMSFYAYETLSAAQYSCERCLESFQRVPLVFFDLTIECYTLAIQRLSVVSSKEFSLEEASGSGLVYRSERNLLAIKPPGGSDTTEPLEQRISQAPIATQVIYHVLCMQVSYLLNELQSAQASMRFVDQHQHWIFGKLEMFFYYFWSILISSQMISKYRKIHKEQSEDTPEVQLALENIHAWLQLLLKWHEHSPVNFAQYLAVLQAEMCRIQANYDQACELYRKAISVARLQKSVCVEALANELLGITLLQSGKRASARYSLLDAIRCYRSWGALAKVYQLEQHYEALLSHVDKLQPSSNANPFQQALSREKDLLNPDMISLLYFASNELQSCVSLGGGLRAIWLQLCITTQAERGCLILSKRGSLFLEIEGGSNGSGKMDVLHSRALTAVHHCIGVINYVTTVRTCVILDEATSDPIFLGDPYIRQHKLKSVMCAPILLHNQILGVIYLQNSLVSGIFTNTPQSLITSVALQMVLAIINHRLSESITRQIDEQQLQQPKLDKMQFKHKAKQLPEGPVVTKMFRRVERIIGYGWEECLVQIASDELRVYEPHKLKKPVLRIRLEFITSVDAINYLQVGTSPKPPYGNGVRVCMSQEKHVFYFSLKTSQMVKEWIMNISASIERQPNIYMIPRAGESVDRATKIWEEEIEILRLLAAGGSSSVFLALWRGIKVTVKQFRTTPENQQQSYEDFVKETKILQSLRHPNILLFIGAYISAEGPCMVAEFLSKGNLFDYVQDQSNIISDAQKLRWVKEICNGMLYLHSFRPPIIHRDLKSLNIFLDDNLVAKVADMGVARFRSDINMTERQGTVAWMAPEVFSGQHYTELADVFSFGVILWELQTRAPLYPQFKFSYEIGQKVVEGLRPPIPENCSPFWKNLMEQCWAADPNCRPAFSQIMRYLENATD